MNNVKHVVASFLQLNVVSRAAHTFIQAFLAVWVSTGFKLDKVALIAAIAAGLSAVKTLVVSSVKVAKS